MGAQTLSMPAFSAGYITSYGFSLWSLGLHMNKENEFGTACRCRQKGFLASEISVKEELY